MRLNPEYFKDPDPEPDPDTEINVETVFKVINTLDDLPKEKKEELDKLSERISEMLEHEEIVNPGYNAIIRYLAFQEMQISALQQGISQIHQMLLMLAQAVDSKEERKNGDN